LFAESKFSTSILRDGQKLVLQAFEGHLKTAKTSRNCQFPKEESAHIAAKPGLLTAHPFADGAE